MWIFKITYIITLLLGRQDLIYNVGDTAFSTEI